MNPAAVPTKIVRELEKISRVHSVHAPVNKNTVNTPVNKNTLFITKPIIEWLNDASTKPVPRRLCGDLWAEGELAIFFGGTGDGKTAFAVQIADGITKGKSAAGLTMEAGAQSVLYLDFELSDRQLLRRYAVEHPGSNGRSRYADVYQFAGTFLRVEVDAGSRVFDRIDDWEQALLAEVEQVIIESGSKIVIVDNITWLSRETDKGKFALPLMQRLCDLKKQHDLSVAVLAHTPKRDETRPISLNDLAGSRILANFADSVFAIGKSASDAGIRYLKQLKVRSSEMVYGPENVAVFQFEKVGNFLGFSLVEHSSESEHLISRIDTEKAEVITKAQALNRVGKSQREIARELNISLGAVNKYVHTPVHTVNTVNTVNAIDGEVYFPPGCDVDEILEREANRAEACGEQ